MSRADGKKSRADGNAQKMYTGVILFYIYGVYMCIRRERTQPGV